MKFDDAEVVESLCYQMRQADYPRSKNRALINNLFNGLPPYSAQEEEENDINFNINFLQGPRVSHDARTQFYQGILNPGNYFNLTLDAGPVHKRQAWSRIVTEEMNKIMKGNMVYTEVQRSKIAMNVLHGIAPAGWRDDKRWCPYAIEISDSLVPGNTLLTMENMPFYAIYRSLSAPEIVKLTQAKVLDPAWNKPMLKAALKWVDKQATSLMSNTWPEVWSPEKTAERLKGDGGFYFGDQVPTINVFDFYFWNDSNKVSGWNRRMVLDAWSMPEESQIEANGGRMPAPTRKTDKDFYDKFRRSFLYNPGNRKIADREQIINWQFADLSAVAPFRYHSVRSLGFLMYSIFHLENRLRCKINDALFEQLMIYFRITGDDDLQRALKVDLVNRGFVDSSINFVKREERYQVDHNLVALGLSQNERIISDNTSSMTQRQNYSPQGTEKTKFQVMAEMQATNQLVAAGLAQAYMYQMPEYREIDRRFRIKDSPDPDVRRFQDRCLKRGVDEKYLYDKECWTLEAERTVGAGNKSLEMAITEQLMAWRPMFDPEPQRDILRGAVLSLTNDPARANALVPENPNRVTDSVHDAQLAAGALLQGLPVSIKTGMNHIEYVNELMNALLQLIQKYLQSQSIPDQDKLQGMFNIAGHIQQHIQIISQDPNEKMRVKQYGDQLGKLTNVLKGFAQQLQQQQQAAAQQNGQDPEQQAKVQAIMQTAQVKNQNSREAHAQRTAQRQIQFELEQKRKDAELQSELQREEQRTAVEIKTKVMQGAADMASARMQADSKRVDAEASSD